MATALSERGCGSAPDAIPPVLPAFVGIEGVAIACTVLTVFGDPPPKTKVELPNAAPDPSWTAFANEGAGLTVPDVGSMV